jgi:RimJ/RimL family protein N-acetyltransferase
MRFGLEYARQRRPLAPRILRAVTEWANAVRGLERVALYSTSWENAASRRLAATLGLVQFGADLHIT